MSRIGKLPIQVPTGVEVKMNKREVSVKGPKGSVSRVFHPRVKITLEGSVLGVTVTGADASSLAGLSRTLLANMVTGVTNGFEKKLEIKGVGFKADVKGKNVVLSLGFSHPVEMALPENVAVKVEKSIITVSGINKEVVGQFSADMRAKFPVEPYKGKGIRYIDEHVRRKVGKKAAAAAS